MSNYNLQFQEDFYNLVNNADNITADDYPSTKMVSIKTRHGKYTTYTKKFNDQRHYDNWYNTINNSGGKVIGINNI